MSHKENDTNVTPAMPSTRVENSSQVLKEKKISYTKVFDIEIDFRIPNRSVAEYKTRHGDALDAWRFGAIFSDGADFVVIDHRNVGCNTDNGSWGNY